MFEVSRVSDPIMHFETEMRFGDHLHFMARTQLQNLPEHNVLFRKLSMGEWGLLWQVD